LALDDAARTKVRKRFATLFFLGGAYSVQGGGADDSMIDINRGKESA
jgi:hypothetical protein